KLAAYQRAYFDEYASIIPAKRILEMRTATIALLKQQLLGLSKSNPTVQTRYEEHKKFFETEIARLEQKSEDEYKELFKRSIDIPNRLSDKAAEVIIALRRELGLDIDEGWFRKTVAKSVTIGQDRQKKLLAELEERLKNERIAAERVVSSSTVLAD